MKLGTRMKQSRDGFRNSAKLAAAFAAAAAVAYGAGISWLARLAGYTGLFFLAVSLLECWNARRLRRRVADGGDAGEGD